MSGDVVWSAPERPVFIGARHLPPGAPHSTSILTALSGGLACKRGARRSWRPGGRGRIGAAGVASTVVTPMRATASPVEGNRVRLSVEMDEDEVDQAVRQTARRLAGQLKVPGFRPGKVPRKVLEARLGGS